MTREKIKELMRAGDVEAASSALAVLLKGDPEDIELKILYGTCRRLLGDMDTFVKIDDELARRPDAAGNDKCRKYHALRVAACGTMVMLGASLSSLGDMRMLYGVAPLYGVSPDQPDVRVLYGIAPRYGISPEYCVSKSVRIGFDAGGGVGSMFGQTVQINECRDNPYRLPACSFSRSGYRFAGWRPVGGCADVPGDARLAAGEVIDLLDYLGVDCAGTLSFVATWQRTGDSDPEEGFTAYARAQTFAAALCSGARPVGMVTVKTGRIRKNGDVKLSCHVQMLDGRKIVFRSTTANGASGRIDAKFAVSNRPDASIGISDGTLSGQWDGYDVVPAKIGGEIRREGEFDFGDLPEEINGQKVAYPFEVEPVAMRDARWTCAKAASMKWVRCPPRADCEYGSWSVNTSNGKTNLSGLKLNYSARKGTFKGTFKVFTLSPGGKKYTVSVAGIVVDGVGYGMAWIKRPSLAWEISVR